MSPSPLIKSCVAFAHTQFYSGVTVKILLRALCAGLAISSLPAMASVTYQDIVSAATNPDDLSRQALVTIFGDVVTNPLSTSDPTLIGSMFWVFNNIIARSEEHTSELQSRFDLVCRLLLEKKKTR